MRISSSWLWLLAGQAGRQGEWRKERQHHSCGVTELAATPTYPLHYTTLHTQASQQTPATHTTPTLYKHHNTTHTWYSQKVSYEIFNCDGRKRRSETNQQTHSTVVSMEEWALSRSCCHLHLYKLSCSLFYCASHQITSLNWVIFQMTSDLRPQSCPWTWG